MRISFYELARMAEAYGRYPHRCQTPFHLARRVSALARGVGTPQSPSRAQATLPPVLPLILQPTTEGSCLATSSTGSPYRTAILWPPRAHSPSMPTRLPRHSTY